MKCASRLIVCANVGRLRQTRPDESALINAGFHPKRALRSGCQELTTAAVTLTALVAHAVKDCSRRSGLVLDPFCGSGTILIAAERTGRKARAMEIDAHYCDVAVRRWQAYTEQRAALPAAA